MSGARHFSILPNMGPLSVPEGDPVLHQRIELQGRVFPAGDLEAYRRTGHRDPVIELPGPGGTRYYLTREYVLSLFDLVEGGPVPQPDGDGG